MDFDGSVWNIFDLLLCFGCGVETVSHSSVVGSSNEIRISSPIFSVTGNYFTGHVDRRCHLIRNETSCCDLRAGWVE